MEHLDKVEILKGLAHPVRLSIVQLLNSEEMCACDIADCFSCDRTTVSKHLALLKRLGIIEDRRDGLNIYYSLKMKNLIDAIEHIDNLNKDEDNCSNQLAN